MDIQNYYYFRLRNGEPASIKVSSVPILLTSYYQQLTQEQLEFYNSNPTASVMEIYNCQLDENVSNALEINEHKAQKLKEFKKECVDALSVSIFEYTMANAVLAGTALTYQGDRYYTTTQATQVMKQYMNDSNRVMGVYNSFASSIENVTTVEEVDTLYNQALLQL